MRICVYCGSKKGSNPAYERAAREVGRVMGERGIGLVYGGGSIGLMGVVADAVLAAGSEVIGIIPRSMVEMELAHQHASELVVVQTMHARKAAMAERADAFLALPGGVGTAEEFFEAVTWKQLNLHSKPMGLLNTEGYYDPLIDWIDRAIQEGFISEKHRGLVAVSGDANDVIDRLTQAASAVSRC